MKHPLSKDRGCSAYQSRPGTTHYWGITAVFILLLTTACSASTRQVAASPLPTHTEIAGASATATPASTATAAPTFLPTDTPAPTSSPTPSPTAIPPGALVNGMPVDEFVILPPEVQTHVLEIYELGQEMERRPNAFSKLGDSGAASPDFLVRFDQRTFDLAQYAYLQETIDYFDKSFQHKGAALKTGLHATSVFAPELLDEELCDPAQDTNMLDCEFRINNPSILLIILGTNDQSNKFQTRMEKIVNYTMERGIIPVLITKADRFEGEDNRNNISIRQLAAQYQLPLIDFDRLANTLPKHGVGDDGVHLSWYGPFEYTSPEPFERGYPMLNLAAIMMLDALRETLEENN